MKTFILRERIHSNNLTKLKKIEVFKYLKNNENFTYNTYFINLFLIYSKINNNWTFNYFEKNYSNSQKINFLVPKKIKIK